MLKSLLTSVSRSLLGVTSLCLVAAMPLSAQAANVQTGTVSVDINKTQVMQLSAPASAIVVGNPAIADVSVHSPTILFVVGRGYGTTNVIILDEFGNVISNSDIQVGFSNSTSSKRVIKVGEGSESYDCNPFCQPAPTIRDRLQFRVEHGGEERLIDNTNSPISNTSISGQISTPGTFNSTSPVGFSGNPAGGFGPSQIQQMRIPFPNGQRPSDGDY